MGSRSLPKIIYLGIQQAMKLLPEKISEITPYAKHTWQSIALPKHLARGESKN